MEKSFPLNKLININELQSIQDSFARAAGISSVIISPEGELLTRFTNPTGFCSLIQSTEKGKEHCFKSFMEMGKIALGARELEICYCFAHSGNFVAPIMINGERKGTMFAGQFTPEKFSCEQLHDLEKIAHEIDLDPELFVKEAEKMRVVGEDVVRNYSNLLFRVVKTIARRGAQAAELERHMQERTVELAEANKELKHEITERKLTEKALQKEKDRAQHYLDVAGVMFLVIGADRKVSLINRKGCEILGYEKEKEIIGKDWFDNFVPERLKDEVAGVFGSLIAGKIEPVEYYENPVLTKYGEERIVAWHNTILRDERGRIYATMASGEDITERKAAEIALRESEEKMRTIAASANDAILMIDHKGNMSYWNKAAERMFCYTKEEVIGKDLHALLVPERFHAGFSKGFEGFKKTGQGAALGKTLEVAAIGKDGKEFPVEFSLSAVKLKDRWNAIGLIRDISERKAVEEEIKKKADELERFNRLAVGREFKMIELKKEINALFKESGKEFKYKIAGKL